ncbi:ABC transporter ATP-binding protein [Furfurilactobacillus curtus]|uniref:Daunorubicin resistance protein DrrA family ABC transporter ATP-binding protein n=1 Tax=Furfurilactobacillus curtus TaxID=1746200 RepID=A0ABQ5JPM8_9LACO
MTVAIKIDHLQKSFGRKHILQDVSLKINSGEIFTLLGENGAGKTTLIEILTTLIPSDAGRIFYGDLSLTGHGAKIRQQISVNAQATTVDANLTGRQNLTFSAKLRDVPDVKQTLNDLIARFDLASFVDQKVATYSGSMRRRLDIAMSLIGDASITFLDKPTTSVDPKIRLEIWQMIREIKQTGRTIFLTTQYLDEADALADHIAFLHHDKIVLDGTPDQLKHQQQAQYQLTVTPAVVSQLHAQFNAQGLPLQFTDNTVIFATDQLAQILQAITTVQQPIESLQRVEHNLEELFLTITQHDRHEIA